MGLNDCIKRYAEAESILKAMGFDDYHVGDLYENGFTANRKSDCGVAMMSVVILNHLDVYTPENIWGNVLIAILRR